ncbi:MAG: uncharacterized protein QOE77_489 [Blastocatellia bacterium]|jgi:hypothetical protein|nr:uncharacterized protein [Blastocatellia bacterium]
MRKTILGFVTLLVLLCGAPGLLAQTATISTKADKIRKILIQTDAMGAFTREFSAALEAQRKVSPEVPPRFWDELAKEVDPNKFVEVIIPIYASFFSDDELSGLSAFYETPLGKKMIATLPQIMSASQAAGAKYGEDAARRVITRMKQEGSWPAEPPLPANPPPQPKP